MNPHLEILPPSQRLFFESLASKVPDHFVLYGGTAIALRLGHRHSVDFDFFSDKMITSESLADAMPELRKAKALQASPNSYVYSLPVAGEPVKLSFFGGLGFGRVGEPDVLFGKFAVASIEDLFGTKLKVIHDRVEAKDYIDIEAILRSGLTLDVGLRSALGLYGQQINPLITVKTLAWFKDGDLEETLKPDTRRFLAKVAAEYDGDPTPYPVKSRRLTDPTTSIGLEVRPPQRRGSSFDFGM